MNYSPYAGIGSQAKALKNIGANFEHYRICEFDKYAVQSYNAVHGTNFATSDITKITADDLGIVDTDKYCYVMTYSFPCFTEDSLVLTDKGYKKIIDIKVGDFVLTHDNTYKKVVNTFNNGKHAVYSIKGMCIDEIKATENHKFFVREMYRKGHNRVRTFKEPKWEELRNINKNHYFGIAINNKNVSIANGKLPYTDNNFWWLIGRYIGDGWIRQQGGIIICCNENEILEITSRLIMLGFKYSIVKEKTVYKIHIAKKVLSNFCEQFGKGASNKHLTNFLLDLPTYYLKDFLVGYLSADGCFTNGVYKATTTSRELVYGIAQCVAKVYKTPYRVYKVNPKPKKVIDGREVNQKDWYQLVFKTEKRKQDKAFYENGYIWYPIKEITHIGLENVYDIEVEDNHSFTVQNTIVHNCQDLSNAGLGKGMAKGSGTRSGLLWEVERLLDECKDLPQVLLMENVPAVIGAKNIQHFAKWQEKLESFGYKNKWQVLNAKDYGIPQNRERCFMVSILGDYYYSFPQGKKLELRLKDMLEKEVDEKYYLSDSMIRYISANNEKWTGNNNKAIINKTIASTLTTSEGCYRCDTSNYISNEFPENFDLKRELCNKLVKSGMVEEGDVIRHSYTKSRMQGDMKDIKEKGVCPTLDTRCDCLGITVKEHKITEPIAYDEQNQYLRKDDCIGTLTTDGSSPKHNNRIVEPISNNFQNISNILLTIFNLCGKIEEKGEIYERNRHLLQSLWEEIGKEKVQWSIRRLWCFQEKEILQSTMYENVNVKNRKSIAKISTSTSNCCKYNEEQTNRKKVFDMWEDWKSRYTSYRWELSKQLFREFNLFMSKLSYEDTQTEVDMQDLRTAYESIRILRETLSKIQKIWQPVENKIQNYRIRKLTPKETWRLMGFTDTDIDKAIAVGMSNAQLYKQAGNSICVPVLEHIFKQML